MLLARMTQVKIKLLYVRKQGETIGNLLLAIAKRVTADIV